MLTDSEIMAQVLAAFQEEQAEHRQAAGELLLELEREPDHPRRQELLDQLFREAHSLKGGARAAGQPEVEQLAHGIEDLFSVVRQGLLQLTPDVCDPVYAALDAIGVMMGQVAAKQPANLEPYQPLMATLAGIVERAVTSAPRAPDTQGGSAGGRNGNGHRHPATEPGQRAYGRPPRSAVDETSLEPPAAIADAPLEVAPATIRLSTASLDALMNETGELITCSLLSRQHARDFQRLTDLIGRWRRVWRQIRPAYARLQERAPTIRPAVHYLAGRDELPSVAPMFNVDHETSILLDALKEANNVIGELERQLGHHSRQALEDSGRLVAVADRLHQQVRRTRMLPLTTIFGQMRLQARDMARAAGKQVVLDLDDGGAEADRQVLEGLREVLLHLLRNALDHGIEASEVRAAAGKSSEGHIALHAQVSGDRLTLTLADDGAGLDLDAIRQRALDRGLMNESDLARLGEAEVADLIFLPGFSTRQNVSPISGRGVGLDIVRSICERMHGSVVVRSDPGAGCVFTISVPLSLTSSHGLLLRAGPLRYVLPLDSVQRIVSVAPRDIQILEGHAALTLDGRPLALVHLADLLGGTATPINPRATGMALQALLLGSGERQVACLVDEVLGEQEMVVHRLPAPLQQVRFIAGATILADGRVVPILDPVDLLHAAVGSRRVIRLAAEPEAPRRTPTVLVVDDSITTRTLEKNILEAAGYHVRLATNGIEALQLLDQMANNGGCDLLLSDVDMPQLNGFELTAQIRADTRFQHLPVVLVTSLDTPDDHERGIAAGADAYIVKRNFEQQMLLDTIAQLIA